MRVLAKGGRFLIFGVRNFAEEVKRIVIPDMRRADLSLQACVWQHGDRRNVQNPHQLPMDHEEILVYYRKGETQELRIAGDVLRDGQTATFRRAKDPLGADKTRPTMKSVALMGDLIETYTKPGDLVVDCTANSLRPCRAACCPWVL
eukprot:Transcript_1014.p3 GENE.Transcript_1014~~Transcript_1014.p3  ORF type:complete len:147 (-),score=29.75 Transcript_1014:142-582(-)